MLADSLLATMSNSPSELNIRSDPYAKQHCSTQRVGNDTDLKSIFTPLGDFFQMLGVALPFGRKPKSAAARFPNLYESSLHKEHIELAQFSLIEIGEPVEAGIGHAFTQVELTTPTWCDLCGDFLWGVYKSKHCVQCQYCNYTCHMRCSAHVTLNCNSPSVPPEQRRDDDDALGYEATLPVDALQFGECGERLLTRSAPIRCQELQRKITTYNVGASPGKEMILSEDGQCVSGFIRVHMNLCRPINVVSEARPPSLHNIIHPVEDGISEKTLTSFYLPRDTIKSLHTNSSATTQEVISALLKKFKVADNPHKYALYERYYDSGESMKVKMRRLQDSEHPLLLVLLYGDAQEAAPTQQQQQQQQQQFVLQENDTGDIPWDAFSLPELNNFLKILRREEEEYLNQVRLKYKYVHAKIQEVLDQWEAASGLVLSSSSERSNAERVADEDANAPIPPASRSANSNDERDAFDASDERDGGQREEIVSRPAFQTSPGVYSSLHSTSQLLDVS